MDHRPDRQIDEKTDLEKIEANSMKFPKPRELLANAYPDLKFSQPELIKKMVRLNPWKKTNIIRILRL